MSDYRLVRHRGQWSLAYTCPERGRVRVATGTAERGLAEARARDLWRARSRPQSERVADLWVPYAADRKATVARPDRFDHIWKPLEPFFGYKLGKAISKADCRAYAEQRKRAGKSNSTIKTELEMLRACLRWHYGTDAPAITAPPPSKPRERYLTRQEADAILAGIETPHVRLFVTLALGTGARAGAILDLTWDRVNFSAGNIDFNPAGRDITNKRRTVVGMTPKVRAALEEAQKGALTDHVIEFAGHRIKSVKRAIEAAAKRSGIAFSAHDLRRSAGRWMAEAGVPMEQISQVLGHTSTRITIQHYARFSPKFMAEAMAALDW
jgi:integrase